MQRAEYAPAAAALCIVITAVLVGPVLGIPSGASTEPGCNVDAFPGTGNVSVTVTDIPERAVIEQSRFGADVWQLTVPDAKIEVSDLQGRPTLTYKLRVNLTEGARAVGSTTILSRCHDTTTLSIERNSLGPDRVTEESYNGTLTVTYRGTREGEDVETDIAHRNVSVEVEE